MPLEILVVLEKYVSSNWSQRPTKGREIGASCCSSWLRKTIGWKASFEKRVTKHDSGKLRIPNSHFWRDVVSTFFNFKRWPNTCEGKVSYRTKFYHKGIHLSNGGKKGVVKLGKIGSQKVDQIGC